MTATIETGALDKALRQLALSGMLETLDARLAQAHAGELGHIEFLQALCEDEISRRESAAIARRQKRAKFEEQVTLEGFDFNTSPEMRNTTAQIRDLATLRWLHDGVSVILFGPVGVGKTFIAQALAQEAIRHGFDVRFFKTSKALAYMAGGRLDGTSTKRMAALAKPAVLILDDWAMRELTAEQADDLYELISDRAGKPVILTSNRKPEDWYPLFPNKVVGESLLDRLINNSYQVFMDGPSYRPNKRPGAATPGRKTSR
jgi:DNA replication protein DnaC